jgi:DNA-binding response OmpR family regulator
LTLSTRLGAAYSLRKPFRPQELLKAVQACIGDAARDPDLKAIG